MLRCPMMQTVLLSEYPQQIAMPTKKDDDSTQNSGGDGDEAAASSPASGAIGDVDASTASVQVGQR